MPGGPCLGSSRLNPEGDVRWCGILNAPSPPPYATAPTALGTQEAAMLTVRLLFPGLSGSRDLLLFCEERVSGARPRWPDAGGKRGRRGRIRGGGRRDLSLSSALPNHSPRAVTLSLAHSPSRTHALTLFTPSLAPTLPPFLHPSLLPSLTHSLPSSLNHSFPPPLTSTELVPCLEVPQLECACQ